jgi:hypothetical protein
MGPHTQQDPTMQALDLYRRIHPEVIITPPEDTPSGLWEVSIPGQSTMAFEDAGAMLVTLSLIKIPDIDT